MTPAPQPLLLGPNERYLFAVLQRSSSIPTAGLLVCGPFFREYVRSYRLFVLLGAALAEHGITVLRFDYYGTGDSGGFDTDFSLHGAGADAQRGLDALRAEIGDAPVIVLGVRAGALPALHIAARNPCALWLWQPLLDAAAYLDELRRRDAVERRQRLGLQHGADDPHSLLGYPCSTRLLDELRREQGSLDTIGPATAITLLDADDRVADSRVDRRIRLDPVLHKWAEQMDMGHFPKAPVYELAAQLTTTVELRERG